MIKYILKRIFYMAISLVIITTITFFLMKLMPGSPFNDAKLSPDQKYILNEKYGLNDPIPIQYLNYMKNVFTGDFGYSFQYHNQPVWDIIKPRLIPFFGNGYYSNDNRDADWINFRSCFSCETKYLDRLFSNNYIGISSICSFFVLAVILQFVFAVKLRWFPVAGWEGISTIILPFFCVICHCYCDSH